MYPYMPSRSMERGLKMMMSTIDWYFVMMMDYVVLMLWHNVSSNIIVGNKDETHLNVLNICVYPLKV